MSRTKSLGVACVGAGYWGKNLVRVFHALPGAGLKVVCDQDDQVRHRIRESYPDTETVGSLREVLAHPEVEAVIVALPAVGHYAAAKQALEAGKHVYVEKPITLTGPEAEELVDLASRSGKTLMVGHLLEYHPAVQLLKDCVRSGDLGEIYYLYSQRVNLGIVRKDENALWNYAPHDISMISYILGQRPVAVSAQGECYLQPGVEDVVFVHLHFGDRTIAHLQLSWLDPHKIRKLTVVGSRKMAVFDDENTEKVRIYDKAAESSAYDQYGDAITLRFGDVVIPHVRMTEPLTLAAQHFLECVRDNRTPRSDGTDGLHVVRVLEAAQRSLAEAGARVEVQS